MIKFLNVIDRQLEKICPPKYIQRRPRSIEENFEFWKTSELKAWLFYYSIPILRDILPNQYIEHCKLLLLAIYKLCADAVTEDEMYLADLLLREFVSRFEDLYGRNHMTNNLHQLRHLRGVVQHSGPLWTTSYFSLEHLNGILKGLIHSSNAAHLQICNGVSQIVSMFTLKNDLLDVDGLAVRICDKILYSSRKKKLTSISSDTFIIGKIQNSTDTIKEEVLNIVPAFIDKNIKIFKQLSKSNVDYTSQLCKPAKTISHFVKYIIDANNNGHGSIKYFIKVFCQCNVQCNCKIDHYAVVQNFAIKMPFKVNFLSSILDFIHEIQDSPEKLDVVNVKVM